jgi:hypothetical protein
VTIIALLLCAGTLYAQDGARGRLNQFVVELANIDLTAEDAPAGIGGPIAEPGWLFIALRGEGEVSVTLTSGGEKTVVLDAPGETMRHVQAGHMAVAVERGEGANLQRLIVRRMPEIMMYMYEGENAPDPQRWITHSWEFLNEAILHSANLIVSHQRDEYIPFAERWHERGGHWLVNHGMSTLRDREKDPAQYWAEMLGGTVWDGCIHDEVLSGDAEHFERYADGLARFRAMPESADKTVYLFCGGTAAIGDPTLLDFFAPTAETSVEGERSVQCMPQSDAIITARQLNVELEPGAEYTISAYMRTEDCMPATYSGVFIIDEGWRSLYGRMRPPEGTSDWTRYEATFTPRPSRNGFYQVMLCGPDTGGMWVDAVQIERGGEPTEFTRGERNLVANPSFEDGLSRWMRGADQGNPLREAVVEHDHAFAPELYLHEQGTEERARSRIQQRLVRLPRAWSRHYEGVNPHALIVLSIGDCALRYSNDHRPDVNYKVLLDMQMHALATESAGDLRGVGFWSAHYGSPEAVRWYGALFRHYCIEGSTERLTDDPYLLDHLTNSGFEDGLAGWETQGAVETVAVADIPEKGGTSKYSGVPEGEMLIRTMREEGAPANSFGQQLRNLEEGRLYSLKLYCADPEYSERLIPAEVTIDGGEVLPEYTWDHLWQVSATHWTMHRRVFRATGTEGAFTVSDVEPGEVYWDFVQVEPYFAG